MDCWTDLLLDPTPVKSVFGEKPPALDGINLHEIILHHDGPHALLRFDLKYFPLFPPKKWVLENSNCVQLQLLAVGVEDVFVSGFRSNITIDLKIKKIEGRIFLHGDNGDVRFSLYAEYLSVGKVSAYLNSLMGRLQAGQ